MELDQRWNMDKQRILLGELVIDKDSPIELHVELPAAEARPRSAALKDRLAFLLDTRFRPASPVSLEKPLSVVQVAELLRCRCLGVLRMIKQGKLHPVSDEDGELLFDPVEVANVRTASAKVYRLPRPAAEATRSAR
jgi:hypothetical protein